MDRIQDALIRANKLGRKGIMVVDYLEPQSATDKPVLTLIVALPPLETASDTPWEDK